MSARFPRQVSAIFIKFCYIACARRHHSPALHALINIGGSGRGEGGGLFAFLESAKQPGPGWTGRHCPALRLRQARASRARASLAAAPVSTTTAQFGAQHKPFRCRRGPYETGFNLGHHTHTPVDANANTRGGGATPQRRATPLPPPFFFWCATTSSNAAVTKQQQQQQQQPKHTATVGRPAGRRGQ